MPLPSPAPRTHLHKRRLSLDGYQREDGMLDIEGHLVDTKTYAFDSEFRGHVAAGTPVHEMWVRLTVDETLTIREAVAETDYGPFPPCYDVAANFDRLIGVRIRPGWMRAVRERIGGTEGCTHINEMLAQVATTAYQTMSKRYEEERRKSEAEAPVGAPKKRPPIIGTCHALAADGLVIKALFPEFYDGPDRGDPGATAADAPAAGEA